MLHRIAALSLALSSISACRSRLPPLDEPAGPVVHIEDPKYVVPQSAYEALSRPPGIMPSLAIVRGPSREWGEIPPLKYEINGFRADGHGCLDADNHASVPEVEVLCPIHPYFLVRGENRFLTEQEGYQLAIERWDYLRSKSIVELAKLGDGRDVSFELDLDLPEWPWVHGQPIVDTDETREALYLEVYAFHDRLVDVGQGGSAEQLEQEVLSTTAAYVRASELRGKPYTFLEEMIDGLQGRPIGNRPDHSVHLGELPHPTAIEVFAGGRLARVLSDSYHLITLKSNLNDGMWGDSGDTVLACDLWYRQDTAGEWTLDAVVPRFSTYVRLDANVSPVSDDNLRALFGMSSF